MAKVSNSTAVLANELTRRSTFAALAASVAMIPASAMAAACYDDPIYMLIEDHRAARAAFCAAMDAVEEIEARRPAVSAARVELGMTESMSLQFGGGDVVAISGRPFYATEHGEIHQHIGHQLVRLPGDAVVEQGALLKRRDVLLAEWGRQEAETGGSQP